MKATRFRFDLPNGRTATFTAKGKKRVVIDEYETLVNCDVRFADGTRCDGILVFDESSSGEHGGTYILIDGVHPKILSQDDMNFERDIKEYFGCKQVFPYKYRYRVPLECSDHHVGPDGWSVY